MAGKKKTTCTRAVLLACPLAQAMNQLPSELFCLILCMAGPCAVLELSDTCKRFRAASHSAALEPLWIARFFNPISFHELRGTPAETFLQLHFRHARGSWGERIPLPLTCAEMALDHLGSLPDALVVETLVRASRQDLLAWHAQQRPGCLSKLSAEQWRDIHRRRFIRAVPGDESWCFFKRLSGSAAVWRASCGRAGLKWFDCLRLSCDVREPVAEPVRASCSAWFDELDVAPAVELFNSVRGLRFPGLDDVRAQQAGLFVSNFDLSPDWSVIVLGFWSRRPSTSSSACAPTNAAVNAKAAELLTPELAREAASGALRIVGDVLVLCSVNPSELQTCKSNWRRYKRTLRSRGLCEDKFDVLTSVRDAPLAFASLSVADLAHPGLRGLFRFA
jgi:hypothetical protein